MTRTKKIIFIEDEEMLSLVIKDSLNAKGFEVMVLNYTINYYQKILEFKPDLLLLDIMLPEVNGFQIAENVIKQLPQLPIVFLSAKTSQVDILKAFNIGAKDYIKKPFTMDELAARLNVAMKTSPKNEYRELEYPESNILKYDYVSSKIIINQAKIQLTHKENELFNKLYNELNKLVSKSELMQLLWQSVNEKNSKNLDVLVVKLRSYISTQDIFKIINLKGTGYKLIMSN